MLVRIKLASLKGIRPHEWIVRFVFGGSVCVIAGLISRRFGPAIGGLFLAFPAIFPASVSLVDAHERMHKKRAGIDGTRRGRAVAGVEAAGTALGCMGLAAFAAVCWVGAARMNLVALFALACLAWLIVSGALWWLRKSRIFRSRNKERHAFQVFRIS